MPSPIQVKTPDSVLIFEFDWSAEVPTGAALTDVVHTVPDPLTIVAEKVDTGIQQSRVTIGGGVHGGLYVVHALATLTTGEQIPGQFTVRVMASTGS